MLAYSWGLAIALCRKVLYRNRTVEQLMTVVISVVCDRRGWEDKLTLTDLYILLDIHYIPVVIQVFISV